MSQLLTMTRMFASNSVHKAFQTVLAPKEGGTKLGWRERVGGEKGRRERVGEEKGRRERNLIQEGG